MARPAISSQLHPNENLHRPSHTRPSSFETPSGTAPTATAPSSGTANALTTALSTMQLHPSASASISPSIRFPLTRPLSPDLPMRDALYLFMNFASYMRSPHEGSEGINSSEDFRDVIRLLDYSRTLAAVQTNNVHILHLKYRFSGQATQYRSPYATEPQDWSAPSKVQERRPIAQPVPQPFSVLHDPVVKVDYNENGVFSPLPAQAVFEHITKWGQPAPRVIVVSYISSLATQNHLASLSTWAISTTPPTYIFSPLETRIRESQPLPIALRHAIPMSMYSAPPLPTTGIPAMPSLGAPPVVSMQGGANASAIPGLAPPRGRRLSEPYPGSPRPSRSKSQSRAGESMGVPELVRSDSHPEKLYPPAPVASLTIEANTGELDVNVVDSLVHGVNASDGGLGSALSGRAMGSAPGSSSVPPQPSGRIPLWALAPGVNILHGSTSHTVGVKLADFSAINLDSADFPSSSSTAKGDPEQVRGPGGRVGKTSPFIMSSAFPPVEAPFRPHTPSKALVVNGMTQAVERAARPARPVPSSALSGARMGGGVGTSASWPSNVSKVVSWKKGRKETMEDVLLELGLGEEGMQGGGLEGLVERVRGLVVEDGGGIGAVERNGVGNMADEKGAVEIVDMFELL